MYGKNKEVMCVCMCVCVWVGAFCMYHTYVCMIVCMYFCMHIRMYAPSKLSATAHELINKNKDLFNVDLFLIKRSTILHVYIHRIY
jgi:hypothetical protein